MFVFVQAGDENDLQILVENCGRINYEHALDYERKGILFLRPHNDP